MKKRNRLGFTMIELLVVIAILGIMAAIVLPRFVGQDVTAKQKKILSDLASLDAALQLYNMDNSAWPPASGWSMTSLQSSGYLAAIPVPPAINGNGISVSGGTSPVPYGYTFTPAASGSFPGVCRAAINVSYSGNTMGLYITDQLAAANW